MTRPTTPIATASFAVLVFLLAMVLGFSTVAGAQDDDQSGVDSGSEGSDDPSEGSDDPSDDPSDDLSDDLSDDPSDASSDDPTEDAIDDPSEDPSEDDAVGSARVFGTDRFATSVAISQYEFPEGSEEVYLARADNFADALAAGSLRRGPTLLVPQCGDLPAVVAAEVSRLGPERVVALGGPSAICDDVIAQAVAAATTVTEDDDSDNDDSDDDDSDDDAPATETSQHTDLAVGEEATYQADRAGTVTIRRTAGGVELVSATPAAGWQIRDSSPDEPGEVEVDFSDGTTRVDFSAEIEDAGVRLRTRVRAE